MIINDFISSLETLQIESSFKQIPLTIMQTQVNGKSNANFSVKIVGIYATALYDTGDNMNCIS